LRTPDSGGIPKGLRIPARKTLAIQLPEVSLRKQRRLDEGTLLRTGTVTRLPGARDNHIQQIRPAGGGPGAGRGDFYQKTQHRRGRKVFRKPAGKGGKK